MKSLSATGLVVGLVLLLLGAEGLKTDGSGPVGPLKKVVFAHRHCARTPMVNTDHSCDVLGCGMCTPEGLKMLKATGESFRQRYGSILPSEYLMRSFKSLSDRDDRTIQSSTAFIKGLFAYNASYTAYPATNTGGKALLDPWWHSLPTYHLHKNIIFGGAAKVGEANLTQHLSLETIMAVGAELGLNCSGSGVAALTCAKKETDFVLSMRSSGTLGQYPVAQKHLAEFVAFSNWFTPFEDVFWQLDVSKDGFFEKAGWPAHALLDSMLTAAGGDDGTILHEYSGHDLTLMPLYAAMGNYTFVYPEFASSMVFEVYENPSSIGKVTDPFVVVKTALPDQLPGSHPLTWFDYELTCQNATSGQIYTTTAGCPLSDMQAFAATRGGTETGKLGGCYAFPSDLVKTNCTNKDGVVPTDSSCLAYRQSCPLVACGPGYYMKSDNSCNRL